MRVISLFYLLTLASCVKQPAPQVAAPAQPSAEEPAKQEFNIETHCDTAETYEDLVVISYFQYEVWKGVAEDLKTTKSNVVSGVTQMFMGRTVMYDPPLPDESVDDVNEALASYQIGMDGLVDTLVAEIETNLGRAMPWKERHDAAVANEKLSREQIREVRRQCHLVKAEIDGLPGQVEENFVAVIQPIGAVVEKYSLNGEGLEYSESWKFIMDPPGLSIDFGEPPPPIDELDALLRDGDQ